MDLQETFKLAKYINDNWGTLGVLISIVLSIPVVLAYKFYKVRMSELCTQLEEHKADKADYRNVITGNTEAITKMTGALEANTQMLRDVRNSVDRRS